MGTISDHGQDIGNKELLPTPHKQAVTAIKAVADVPELATIEEAISFVSRSWMAFTELKSAFKAEEARHKERLEAVCEQYGIKSVELYDGIKLQYKEVKKTVYDNEKIFKALGFNERQAVALSKSDIWLKSGVESLPETCEFVTQQVQMEMVQDKPKVKKKLAEFNPAFAK